MFLFKKLIWMGIFRSPVDSSSSQPSSPPHLESLLYFMKLPYQFLVALSEVKNKTINIYDKASLIIFTMQLSYVKIFSKWWKSMTCGLIWVETLTINLKFLDKLKSEESGMETSWTYNKYCLPFLKTAKTLYQTNLSQKS